MTGFRTCIGTSVLLDLLSHLLFFAEDPTSNLWKKNIKCVFKQHKQGETLLSSGSCSSNAWEVHIGIGVKGLSLPKYTVHAYLSDCIRVNLTIAKIQNVCGGLMENSYYIITLLPPNLFTKCLEILAEKVVWYIQMVALQTSTASCKYRDNPAYYTCTCIPGLLNYMCKLYV